MTLETCVAQRIAQALQGLEHGSIQLVIHDAQIVRIERIEKVRLSVTAQAWKSQLGRPADSSEARRDESVS